MHIALDRGRKVKIDNSAHMLKVDAARDAVALVARLLGAHCLRVLFGFRRVLVVLFVIIVFVLVLLIGGVGLAWKSVRAGNQKRESQKTLINNVNGRTRQETRNGLGLF